MDARSHQSTMSYSGAYGSTVCPKVCDRRIIDPTEMEINEMSFIGSSATTSR